MKKLILASILVLIIHFLSAQEMKQGNNFFSVGIGPAANYWSTYHSGGTPAIRLALDHGFKEVGPGTITLGGALGFFSKYYKSTYYDIYNNMHYNYKWTFTYLSAVFRGGYYYNLKEADIPDMNVYGGIGMGLLYSGFHEKYDGPNDGSYLTYDNSGMDFLFNFYLGANYFLTPKTAAYLEFGYDISYVTLGLTFNLN